VTCVFNPYRKWRTESGDCCAGGFFGIYDPAFRYWRNPSLVGGSDVWRPCPMAWYLRCAPASADSLDLEITITQGGKTVTRTFSVASPGVFLVEDSLTDSRILSSLIISSAAYVSITGDLGSGSGTWGATFGPAAPGQDPADVHPARVTKSGIGDGYTASFAISTSGAIS
jgi:hypothetical protein